MLCGTSRAFFNLGKRNLDVNKQQINCNEIMQYSTFGNDIALIMHYRALFTMSGYN